MTRCQLLDRWLDEVSKQVDEMELEGTPLIDINLTLMSLFGKGD